jgi:hypothetical protein
VRESPETNGWEWMLWLHHLDVDDV